MATSIEKYIADLRYSVRYSNAATKIVWLNIIIFVLLRLIGAACVLTGHDDTIYSILQWSVEVPSSPALLLTRPWTIITYMFAQYDVWHIIFNLLCFYWFGVTMLNVTGSRRLWLLYVSGGIVGAAAYIAGCNVFPGFSSTSQWLIGGSAAVLAVISTTAILCPDLRLYLFLFGEVKLKWVALVIIILSFVSGIGVDNLAGNFAHAGGILAGILYAILYRRRYSLSRLTARITMISRSHQNHNISADARNIKTASDGNRRHTKASPEDIRRLDDILDKIKVSGYASLTSEERKALFEVSNRIK